MINRLQSTAIYNYATIRAYGDSKFKLCGFKRPMYKDIERRYTPKGEADNDGKLDNNITRAKTTIKELSMCNPWELFATFTFSPDKYDRTDLRRIRLDFSQFIRNFNKAHNLSVKYLSIPEMHKNGAWHLHSLIMGLPLDKLTEFSLQDHIPYKILNKIREGKHVYNWELYNKKFGFVSLECIEDQERLTNYITKYVTKDLAARATEQNSHLFFASQKLARAVKVADGILKHDVLFPDYENEHVSVKWFYDLDNAKEAII